MHMRSYLSKIPIKMKLLIYFVPIIVSSVLLTGFFSYYSAVKQLERNAYYLLNDTVEQTGIFLNEKFHSVFEQLVIIENNTAYQNILANNGQGVDEHRYEYSRYSQTVCRIVSKSNSTHRFHLCHV